MDGIVARAAVSCALGAVVGRRRGAVAGTLAGASAYALLSWLPLNGSKSKSNSRLSVQDEDTTIIPVELLGAFEAAVEEVSQRGLLSSSDDRTKLAVYALFKQAKNGPCTTAAPSSLNFVARAKWDAWSDLGKSLSRQDAMVQYIQAVEELKAGEGTIPSSETASSSSAGKSISVGGSVSTLQADQSEKTQWSSSEELFRCANQGDTEGLLKVLTPGNVNEQDENGCTALHWGCDRGHAAIVTLLLERGADVNAGDADGSTPLHYAILNDEFDIAKILALHGGDLYKEDDEGESPIDSLSSTIKAELMNCSKEYFVSMVRGDASVDENQFAPPQTPKPRVINTASASEPFAAPSPTFVTPLCKSPVISREIWDWSPCSDKMHAAGSRDGTDEDE